MYPLRDNPRIIASSSWKINLRVLGHYLFKQFLKNIILPNNNVPLSRLLLKDRNWKPTENNWKPFKLATANQNYWRNAFENCCQLHLLTSFKISQWDQAPVSALLSLFWPLLFLKATHLTICLFSLSALLLAGPWPFNSVLCTFCF